jgi:hypothetical protein
VSDRWYGPDEQWPAHNHAWWRKALAEARRARWHLLKLDGHSWGKVVCSRTIPDEAHEKVVFSTGRGSENVARDLTRMVRRCRHPRDGERDEDLRPAIQLLDGAERLLDAASKCLSHQAHEERAAQLEVRALELLELAEANLAEAAREAGVADRLEDEFDRLVDEARAAEAQAQSDLIATHTEARRGGFPADGLHTPSALVDEANARIDSAEAQAALGHAGEEKAHVLRRAAALRVRAERTRNRIGQ